MAAPIRRVCNLFIRPKHCFCSRYRCTPRHVYTTNTTTRIASFSTQTDEDFFGLNDKDNESAPRQSRIDDNNPSKINVVAPKTKRYALRETSYGTIRYDTAILDTRKKNNRDVVKRSKFKSDLRPLSDDASRENLNMNYFDDQHFSRGSQFSKRNTGTVDEQHANYSDEQNSNPSDFSKRNSVSSKEQNDNYFDEQYFSHDIPHKNRSQEADNNSELPRSKNSLKRENYQTDLNYFDKQYFSSTNEKPEMIRSNEKIFQRSSQKYIVHEEEFSNYRNNSSDKKDRDMNYIDNQYFSDEISGNNGGRMSDPLSISHKDETLRKVRKDLYVKSRTRSTDRKTHKTAFDVALEMRKTIQQTENVDTEPANSGMSVNPGMPRFMGPVDSKGYRILKTQVPDIMHTPSAEVVNLLRNSIVYHQDNIIALNKPYGLPSHGGPGVHMSVGQLLPALAKLLDPSGKLDKLHLVHRLDRQTTGLMLIAKTAEMAWMLHGAFRKREVVKTYWVVTKGIPKPEMGIIDIPISEGTVDGYHRMVLKPEMTSDTRLVSTKSSMKSGKALTKYQVLSSYANAALVECTPETGLKHQIRVHLAFGLNTPILGDHKYSHITKMAPQRLDSDSLHYLGIRQSKVRHLPMMLHAKSLMLPEFKDGRNIFISCRLPSHFTTNMKRLKIQLPGK